MDAVIVGSGFGASVAALRLAEAGQSVVLMERGRPYAPGEFARYPDQMGANFWDPDRQLYGLFDAWTFRGLEGLVSAGLGGGSLIYANVLLRKDEKWFVRESPVPGGGYENWPFTRADLDPYYDRAEQMLTPVRYPYQNTPKTNAMEASAATLGLNIQRPPIAVTFSPTPGGTPRTNVPLPPAPYGSVHGPDAVRTTCTLCGECDLGCNSGAKNTLDHTYLSAAKYAGADLRTLHDVRGIRPVPGGYEVRYVVHDPEGPGGLLAERIIRCRRLVLGAGTFGTNFLLLRNRGSLPGLSSTLGTRFSGNGDLLTFILDAKTPSPDGEKPGVRTLYGSDGPVITTAIRVPDTVDGGTGRGYYVEDAGYPAFMNWLIETADLTSTAERTAKVALQLLKDRVFEARRSNISSDLAAALGDGHLSASSLPLLGMGRDVPDGVMGLAEGKLEIDWTIATSEKYFARVRGTMEDIAGQLDGRFVDNPLWWAKRVITVHPIGGAPAGDNPSSGVCDPYGEVFGYPGLYVVDGAAMPGPVGANPSLTIAAFAERACERLLSSASSAASAASAASATSASATSASPTTAASSPAASATPAPTTTAGEAAPSSAHGAANPADAPAPSEPAAVPLGPRSLAPDATKGLGARRERPGAPLDAADRHRAERRAAAPAGATSVAFTEQMHGWFSPEATDPAVGSSLGREQGKSVMFELTITAPDIEEFVADPSHAGVATGYLVADQYGGRLPVERGWFNLFVDDGSFGGRPARRMLYRLWVRDPGGTKLTFTGHKLVREDGVLNLWRDTSTLYATFLHGHVPPPADGTETTPGEQPEVVGAGILHIRPPDFAKQLTTFRTAGPAGPEALATFGRFFLGQLWTVYGPGARRALSTPS
ncbi:GMC family oxidoreductase [Sinomonas sp. ASV322]|uniref:GMC family oxidoreductase n=1 Tax=Sinomonas sp. ASV322 TaxID=3041920 RepID=UPI0027DC3382|nr:GMC family oxidoreductase [Sinomonas sp. ASV322]